MIVRKELAVSLLTVCGALATVGVSYAVRSLPVFRDAVGAGGDQFVIFIVYGLAISLISASSTVMRRRDTVILILAATIAWVVFVETRQLLGMVRFLVFASLATVGVLAARRAARPIGAALRVLRAALVPAGLCGAAGVIYYGLVAYLGPAPGMARREMVAGGASGFGLGLAVGLGLALGGEALRWISRES